jgi:hypothetical protein
MNAVLNAVQCYSCLIMLSVCFTRGALIVPWIFAHDSPYGLVEMRGDPEYTVGIYVAHTDDESSLTRLNLVFHNGFTWVTVFQWALLNYFLTRDLFGVLAKAPIEHFAKIMSLVPYGSDAFVLHAGLALLAYALSKALHLLK